MELGSEFRELLTLLNECGVKYLVVGSYALAGHGFPRYTKDLDVFYEFTPENARALLQTLDKFGFGDVGLSVADFEQRRQTIQLGFPPNRIDFLNDITGVTFAEAWQNRKPVDVDGLEFFILGKNEYIKNKTAVGRLQDLADAEKLGYSTADESE
jgi:hypothetical protein